ncbi:FAD-binding oxidoreductase [Amycolatopsis sp. TNS106]|uniref:FAD-binding oxidoreductase n=1 Tax=Amycolatopsis sp. TNS106 TaxID=2861750 RepID=UPI001C574B66|nr:FAD-binding oxidoreductase [Amycolatopsis sp. TNS106]
MRALRAEPERAIAMTKNRSASLAPAELAAWRSKSTGDVLVSADPGFDQIVAEDVVVATPAVIVRPATAGDVGRAVSFATEHGLPVSVRGGGHGPFAVGDGDLLILLSALDEVRVHDDGQVEVGGGAVWGQVAHALRPHGLALSSGDTSSVGVGGLTLTGGVGWLVRRHGLALDNLVAAEIVTASGQVLAIDAEHHADLFWAIRGGGGNFGIVTRFTFQAHPLPGTVRYGTITTAKPSTATGMAELLGRWRDVLHTADERLNSTVFVMPPEERSPANCQFFVLWGGDDEDEARAAIAPLLELPGILHTSFDFRPYVSVLEDGGEPDALEDILESVSVDAPEPDAYIDDVVSDEHNAFVVLDDGVIASLAELIVQAPGSILSIRSMIGAVNRVPPTATAFGWRDTEALVIFTGILPPGSGPQDIVRIEEQWSAISAGRGSYGNFRDQVDDPFTHRVYAPVNTERLIETKRRWDPENVFAGNHNIKPRPAHADDV